MSRRAPHFPENGERHVVCSSAYPMAPLLLLVSAAAFSFLSHSTARAAVTVDADAAPVVLELPSPSPSVASFEAACPLPNEFMRVLNLVEAVGVTRVDRTAKLVSRTGVADTERLPVRVATWASVSEPPRMPILYSRMMQLDF